MGNDWPLFSCIHRKLNKRLIPAIVVGYHKLNINRFNLSLNDGSQNYVDGKQIQEFADEHILFTSCLSNTIMDSAYINYINPANRIEAMSRWDKELWLKAEEDEKKKYDKHKCFKNWTNTKPIGVYIHTLRFVYQLLMNADGTLNKYKVRIVFRGLPKSLAASKLMRP